MTGPKQTSIIPAVPGEPITQTLLNQIIDGANNARMVSGDGNIRVNQVGGNVGMSLARKPGAERQALLQVLSQEDGGTITTTGLYYAKIYGPQAVAIPADGDTAYTPEPVPEVISAVAVNLAEVNPATSATGSLTATGSAITTSRMAMGRWIGFYDGWPLYAVDMGSGGGESHVFVKQNGTGSGELPIYDIFALRDPSMTTKLNDTPLEPENSRARWPSDMTGINLTAAADGSIGDAVHMPDGTWRLLDVPEKICVSELTYSVGAV